MMTNIEKELEHYKREVIELENYLVGCINMFTESGLRVQGKIASRLTLGDWIKWGISSVKELRNKPPVIVEKITTNDDEFLKGVRFAYSDCIQRMQEIADDTEEDLPKNKKIRHRLIYTASGYRQIGDSFHTRMNIVMDMEQDEIQEMRNGGRLGRA